MDNTNYPKQRGIDGIYYRVNRNDKQEDVCFTDLTVDEQKRMLETLDNEALKKTCLILADTVRAVGDLYNICFVEE